MNRSSASHPRVWAKALAGLWGLMLGLAIPAAAQYPPIPTTPVPTVPGTSPYRLVGIGSVAPIGTTGFRLTPSAPYRRGAVWLVNKQSIAGGFQTTFQFRLHSPGGLALRGPFGLQFGGDGFAFVIQNYSLPVVGPFAGYMGYHGIPNSLAVEFDTWWNTEYGFFDPNTNHVSVHTRGRAANSASEAASIGRTTVIPFLKDGAVHTVRIDYVPGTLRVFVDNLAAPVLTIPGVNLASLLQLDATGSAWMGFTAGTGSAYQTHDVLSWTFGPPGVPLVSEGPFPVTTTPSTPQPTTPTRPYVLPPSPTSPTEFVFPP